MSKYKTKRDKIKRETKSDEICPISTRSIVDAGCEHKPVDSEPWIVTKIFYWLLILVTLASSAFVLFGFFIAIFNRDLFDSIFPGVGGVFFYPIGVVVLTLSSSILIGQKTRMFDK